MRAFLKIFLCVSLIEPVFAESFGSQYFIDWKVRKDESVFLTLCCERAIKNPLQDSFRGIDRSYYSLTFAANKLSNEDSVTGVHFSDLRIRGEREPSYWVFSEKNFFSVILKGIEDSEISWRLSGKKIFLKGEMIGVARDGSHILVREKDRIIIFQVDGVNEDLIFKSSSQIDERESSYKGVRSISKFSCGEPGFSLLLYNPSLDCYNELECLWNLTCISRTIIPNCLSVIDSQFGPDGLIAVEGVGSEIKIIDKQGMVRWSLEKSGYQAGIWGFFLNRETLIFGKKVDSIQRRLSIWRFKQGSPLILNVSIK